MAIRLAKAEEAMRAERQLLKERVLQIDQLTAEAEVSGDLTVRREIHAFVRVPSVLCGDLHGGARLCRMTSLCGSAVATLYTKLACG
jgi:hypothetical protein